MLDDYNGAAAHIAIFIDIAEGPQWFVSKLIFEGVSDDVRPRLLLFLHSTSGQPYSDLNIATDRDNILDYYFNSGYPAAKFDFTSMPAPEARSREPDVYRYPRASACTCATWWWMA